MRICDFTRDMVAWSKPTISKNTSVPANAGLTLAIFMAASVVAATDGMAGFLKCGMTERCMSSSSPTLALLDSTIITRSATCLSAGSSCSVMNVCASSMSPRLPSVIASALEGLSCTMPSELSGMPVDAANSLASVSIMRISGSGELDGSCVSVGVWPCLSAVASSMGLM